MVADSRISDNIRELLVSHISDSLILLSGSFVSLNASVQIVDGIRLVVISFLYGVAPTFSLLDVDFCAWK